MEESKKEYQRQVEEMEKERATRKRRKANDGLKEEDIYKIEVSNLESNFIQKRKSNEAEKEKT